MVTHLGGKEALFLEPWAGLRSSTMRWTVTLMAWVLASPAPRWTAGRTCSRTIRPLGVLSPAELPLLTSELERQQTVPSRKVLGESGAQRDGAGLIAGLIMQRYGLQPARSIAAAFASSLQHAISGPLAAPARVAAQ